MDDRYKVTPEIIDKANAYLPLGLKAALAKGISFFCVNVVRYDGKKDQAEDSKMENRFPVPVRYEENAIERTKYLMSVFLRYYLGVEYNLQSEIEIDPKKENIHLCIPDLLISDADYDRFAGSFVFNQIKRLKKTSVDLQDKAFDLLSDFKDFEKRLGVEINNLIQRKNDPVNRFAKMAEEVTDPAWIGDLGDEMKRFVEAAEKKQGAENAK